MRGRIATGHCPRGLLPRKPIRNEVSQSWSQYATESRQSPARWTIVLGVFAPTTDTAAASPVQAAGLVNCGPSGATTPCFEKIWSDGNHVKMTFVDSTPHHPPPPVRNSYVMALQTRPPGHCALPARPRHRRRVTENHGDGDGNNLVRYHAFFVLCSAQGISSGGCVPTMTSIPGLGTIPFAKTVNGHKRPPPAP